MTAPALVTGATGTVGSAVVHRLCEQGVATRAAVRDDADAAQAQLPEQVHRVPFDFTEPATFPDALQGVRHLFLVRPPALSNVKQHLFPFIRAAETTEGQHVVLLSLLGAEHNPLLPHRRIEKRLEASSLAYTFLRPSFFMQNLSTTHRTDIRERSEIFVPAGRGSTSFIDARDIGAVAAEVLTTPHRHQQRAYDLTGPAALSYGDVAAVFTDVLDRRVTYPNPSILAFGKRMYARGQPFGFILVMISIYTTCRLGLADTVTRDVEQLLGRPPTTLRQFVCDYRDVWL